VEQGRNSVGNEFNRLKISIGIPIYNEQELLKELIKRIESSFRLAGLLNYEIVFTDNCSTDQSFDVLEKYISKKNSRIKVIQHARNYGYQTSLRTCLENSNGDYIAIMDGDLQDPPELIPEMLKTLLIKKANIVYGVRSDRAEKFFKKLSYKLFYKFWHKVADIEIQIDSGEFAIYDRYSANQILKFKEKNRFQRGIRAYLGLKQGSFSGSGMGRQMKPAVMPNDFPVKVDKKSMPLYLPFKK
jgi:dolichol-phosphate mannosyltransferase